eukprot:5485680-Prymnesium_polylepis.1
MHPRPGATGCSHVSVRPPRWTRGSSSCAGLSYAGFHVPRLRPARATASDVCQRATVVPCTWRGGQRAGRGHSGAVDTSRGDSCSLLQPPRPHTSGGLSLRSRPFREHLLEVVAHRVDARRVGRAAGQGQAVARLATILKALTNLRRRHPHEPRRGRRVPLEPALLKE